MHNPVRPEADDLGGVRSPDDDPSCPLVLTGTSRFFKKDRALMRIATPHDLAPGSARRRAGHAALVALLLAGLFSFAVAALSPS
jgi:hypothetical protein